MSQPSSQSEHTLKPEPVVFESNSIESIAAVLEASLRTYKDESIADAIHTVRSFGNTVRHHLPNT